MCRPLTYSSNHIIVSSPYDLTLQLSRKRERAPRLNTPTHHFLTGNQLSAEPLLTSSDIEFLQTYSTTTALPPRPVIDFEQAERDLIWFFWRRRVDRVSR